MNASNNDYWVHVLGLQTPHVLHGDRGHRRLHRSHSARALAGQRRPELPSGAVALLRARAGDSGRGESARSGGYDRGPGDGLHWHVRLLPKMTPLEAASAVYGVYTSTKFMTESMAVSNVLHGH